MEINGAKILQKNSNIQKNGKPQGSIFAKKLLNHDAGITVKNIIFSNVCQIWFCFFCFKIRMGCSRFEQAWSLSNHATKRFKLRVEIKHLN